jgi:hypothetical protein
MKLIKMTDYISQKRDIMDREMSNQDRLTILESILHYSNFLKTPLNLGMFIPCDEKFNILKKPNHYRRYVSNDYLTESPKMSEKWVEKCKEYKKAESNILFKDFHFVIEEDGEKCVAIEGFVLEIEALWLMKVEDITDQDIELTIFCINAINYKYEK